MHFAHTALLFVLLCVTLSSCSSFFAWSQREVSGKNVYSFNQLCLRDVGATAYKHLSFEDKNIYPLFILEEGADIADYQPFLKEVVLGENVLSSSVHPNVFRFADEPQDLQSCFKHSDMQVQEVSIHQLITYLQEAPVAEESTLLLITLPSSLSREEVNSLLSTSYSALRDDHQLTHGGLLFLPPTSDLTEAEANLDSELASGVQRRLIYEDGTYVYMTPDLLAGILTGLFFVFVAWLGMSCIGEILTPARNPTKSPAKGREF